MKIKIHALLILAFSTLFFTCKKSDVNGPQIELPDFETRISTSASGFVTDENNSPVIGASVRMGTAITTTNDFGYFNFEDVQVVKTAAVITVTHSGYFSGIRTFAAKENATTFVRIKLSPKTIIGTIDASSGGSVSTPQGFTVEIPVGAVTEETTGAAYTGTVTVLAKWLDPTSSDIHETMPGDLRALNTDGEMKLLITYGMAGVELIGDAGQQLQIASGRKSILSFPIPASMNATAPATIPLWHFDEEKGLWIEEGSAVKTGNNYVGEVGHFTFWNVDVPQNFTRIEGRIVGDNGSHMAFVGVKITDVNDPTNSRFGITNSQGYFDGFVPVNSTLKLDVVNLSGTCYVTASSQTFQTTNTAINLGDVVITVATSGIAQISGTLVDCNNHSYPRALIFCNNGNSFWIFHSDSLGNFDFNLFVCQSNEPWQFTIVDTSGVPTPTQSFTLNSGPLSLDTIRICNSPMAEFFSYAINGVPESYIPPNYDLIQTIVGNEMRVQIIGPVSEGIVVFNQNGTGVDSEQQLYSFSPVNGMQLLPVGGDTIWVRITEFGPIGEYIAGHFSGNMASPVGVPGPPVSVQASFRVRRVQ